ncbi:MAG TPA: metallophosphoesterase, partial [Allocoleopsis sp.]
SLGNHDYYTTGAVPYLDYFTLPTASSGNERYYDFVKGSVHFFIVNSNSEEADGTSSTSAQATWLKNRLAASTSPWKVVIFHHAPYSSDTDHGSTTRMQWPFKDWGANIVLSGHAHTYERVDVNGLTYIVNGLGGAGTYGFKSTPVVGSQIRYNTDWGAQLVEATDTTITFKFYNTAGTLIDTYTMSKSGVGTTTCTGSNTQSCQITNGVGTQSGTCVSGSWSWGTCKVTSCNSGYMISGNSCISSNSVTTTVIAKGSSWKYLDDGSNQGTSWISSSFSDSTWKTGNAELGYGDGDEATIVSYGPSSSTKYITTYFRKTFDVTDASKISSVSLGLKADDAGIVYINGVEVHRFAMPTGTPSYTTLASSNNENYWTFNPSVSPSVVLTGSNIVAVEIHQDSPTSSDISFNLELNVTTS